MKETAPFWSFRGRSAYTHSEKNPGPGTYSPTASVMHASPKYGVGTSLRKSLDHASFTPGPGAYTLSQHSDTPVWTM